MTKKNIDYITIREDFSIYECENGQILRLKSTLSSLVADEEEGKETRTGIELKEISNVFTPKPIDTADLKTAKPEDVTKENEREELKFKPLKVINSIYETEKSLIIICPMLEKIILTDCKDSSGNPIVRYALKNALNVIAKKLLLGPEGSQDPQVIKKD